MSTNRMGRIEDSGRVLTCKMDEFWPPPEMRVYSSAVAARSRVSEARYEQLRTWERVCGLTKMDRAKCITCPNLVIDGVPTTKVGGIGRPPPSVKISKMKK